MTVGIVVSKTQVDALVGGLAQQIDGVLLQVQQLKAWMDTQTDVQLIALGWVQAEVNTLRSAVTDLDQLRQVYQGTATRTPVYDYRVFAKLLTGIGVH